MAVVARVRCNYTQHWEQDVLANFSPVVSSTDDDPHAEEIKRFHAATPSGNVSITAAGLVAPLGAKAGDQFYVYFDSAGTMKVVSGTPVWLAKVTSIQIQSYGTLVKLEAPMSDGIYRPCIVEFSIRNEVAAEQFQLGGEFYVTLKRIDG